MIDTVDDDVVDEPSQKLLGLDHREFLADMGDFGKTLGNQLRHLELGVRVEHLREIADIRLHDAAEAFFLPGDQVQGAIEARTVGARLHRALSRSTEYAEPFIVTAAVLAVFGHPLFYVIWRFLIPQPFEDLSLRLVGSLVALPVVFKNHWPARLKKFLPYYWHFGVLFTLPFFFSLILFLSEFS